MKNHREILDFTIYDRLFTMEKYGKMKMFHN